MKATFENTVDILVKAYINGTLEHANCCACVVGNIIRANGVDLTPNMGGGEKYLETSWLRYLDAEIRRERFFTLDYDKGIALKQISVTGYTANNLSKIEKAFESANIWGLSEDEAMFKGLMSVVDVLAEIHGVSLEQSKEAKLMFVKS